MSFVSIKSKKSQVDTPKMDFDLNIPETEIRISDGAARRIRELILRELDSPNFLRVGITGGGCSGLSYTFSFEKMSRANDLIFEHEDAAICVDPKSMKLLGGSLLHWQDSLKRAGFQILNKKSHRSCSCGESFSA